MTDNKSKNSKPSGFRDPRLLAGLPAHAPLAVALSGGADSVALLAMLREAAPVYALHVHHHIRGEEADRDAAFCRCLAERLGVPFTLLSVDAPARADETGESLETAAREARYTVMADWMRQNDVPLLVTAHHADDQLETMLQHLLRGSGTRGLSGIPSCRPLPNGLAVARPLLRVPKAELLAYLEANGLSYVTDSTNLESCCQRNFLRLRVLPLLEELRPGAAATAARCAEALAADEAFLDSLAAEFLATEGNIPTAEALLKLPSPVFVRVMRRLLPAPPEAVHVEALRALLLNPKPHAALSLPPRTRVSVERGRLVVSEDRRGRRSASYLHPLAPGANPITEGDALIFWASAPHGIDTANDGAYTYRADIALHSPSIKGTLVARPRLPGDLLLSGGMHKAVRRLRGPMQLPPDVRARMPLLTDDAGVLAVPFGPARDAEKCSPDTFITVYFS